ncbi:unnamed protein product [Linum tenue]|uniref:DUF4283 domain-containing protein n=1 Tax=Linum tenue TaxID=586396 RepID=A0AAV0IYD6_9ROSI|nr:unnamed protein product [Linum tenue]
MKNGCYLVRFRSQKDFELASEKGPWLLGDTYLTVHRWFKGFNPWKAKVTTTIVWVQLPDLPIEFFNAEAVTMIAELIGKPIRVDRATEMGARGNYARASVEVDLTKPLLSMYKVEGVTYIIQYEGLDNICGECGMYGQMTNTCSCKHMGEEQSEEPSADAREEPIASQTEGRIYGEWMSVKKKSTWAAKRIGNTKRMGPINCEDDRTNSFAALHEEEGTPISENEKNSMREESAGQKNDSAKTKGKETSGSTSVTSKGGTPSSGGQGVTKSSPLNPPTEKDSVAKEKRGNKDGSPSNESKRALAAEMTRHAPHAKEGTNSSKLKTASTKPVGDGPRGVEAKPKQTQSEGAGNRSPSRNK